MGAWGGWALAPNTAMGRDYRSHMKLVAESLPHVQNGRRIFLTSWVWIPEREPIARRAGYRRQSPTFPTPLSRPGGSRGRIAGKSFGSEAFSPVLGCPLFVSLDAADPATSDETS